MRKEIPPEYEGREQTLLKHWVLKHYLDAWTHKLGSLGQYKHTRLWYIDCFAGPWRARSQRLEDTSPYIGLQALKQAAETWAERDADVEVAAIFVEKDPSAFRDLEQLVRGYEPQITVHAIPGEFGDHVKEIDRLVGTDPAFLFVDPTGWKGAAMCYLHPLVSKRRRDVLVNVMFHDINRFKGRDEAVIREQIADFFGLEEGGVDQNLREEGLMELYRTNLKTTGSVPFAADLVVPHPTINRTKFRLVVGGHDKAVLKVFRQVENRVLGREAAWIRDVAKEREREARTRQQSLISLLDEPIHADVERGYDELNRQAYREVEEHLPELLREAGPMLFADVWPIVLQQCHVTESELAHLIMEMHKAGQVKVEGLQPRQKRVKDDNRLSV